MSEFPTPEEQREIEKQAQPFIGPETLAGQLTAVLKMAINEPTEPNIAEVRDITAGIIARGLWPGIIPPEQHNEPAPSPQVGASIIAGITQGLDELKQAERLIFRIQKPNRN